MSALRPILAITAGAMMLHGCAVLSPEGQTTGAGAGSTPGLFDDKPSDRDLSELLRYYQYTADWSEKALDGERRSLQPALSQGRCNTERFKMSLIALRAAERSLKLDGPAEDLLKPCLAEPGLAGSGLQGLALLVSTQLREASAGQQRLKAGAQELEATKRENQELRRQLEGLKAIERSLQDRRRR